MQDLFPSDEDLVLLNAQGYAGSPIRDEDTASRLGGDEFVLLLSELSGDPQLAAQQGDVVKEFCTPQLSCFFPFQR
ncbi:MAG: GGDEF domain-containing protein [Candidatus Thiodiazotropha sp. (ex Lucinoma aequizonata)]|nr:GGDEF domain-containing protein [Candidatus Thiodiazotropha sp. (ex Lucinoma aequizonata)]MCU7888242.1 GGDEF domain-containing protein [Candidatus Thiodiazotropha sp. (ex Lucinoma aequizonata)]MCU7896182.1 GGDEF domain-containing protein [Candidatus Thiodiazotropha sp. (ex Lucinoma aequizonata)]MCU7898905.1 GGDEF domain-containing protein [Candidatus Thiodiazotropha sp. (ex Lucinoma aequizonata)]MCU7902734.1 GGDEF domain-containing protein [Candidatus Thiodiazotropha sp. (ex Lucinoma aequizo